MFCVAIKQTWPQQAFITDEWVSRPSIIILIHTYSKLPFFWEAETLMIKSSEKKKELHSALSKSIQIDRRTKKRERTSFFGCNRKKEIYDTRLHWLGKILFKSCNKNQKATRRHMEWQSYNRPIWLPFEYFRPVFAYLLSRECPFGPICCGLEKWHMIKNWSFVLEQQYVYLMILCLENW